MTKTVKQIVDEYKNRSKRHNLFGVMFLRDGKRDGYCKVTNVYRDGIKIETPDIDNEYHIYEFDSGFQPTTLKPDLEWTHRKFTGKIIEVSQEFQE